MIPRSLKDAAVVFWDFDGVVKDSVTVKSVAFEQLFLPYGSEIAHRVRLHHEAHSGVSRYEKLPIYLGWAGESTTAEQVQDFCHRFSDLVQKAVIDAAWVPGVREYLQAHHDRQCSVLVTATPQEEIQQILHVLAISHCFREVHGAPTPKSAAIRGVLERMQCPPEHALVVGDSEADLGAAAANNVAFLLRRTVLNTAVQDWYSGPTFENLADE